MTVYPYRPLNLPHETRILTVHPGKFADAITCNLSHITIASPDEPYEALSYCWSKGVDRGEDIGPEVEIPWAVYGEDENGNTISESGTSKWKDLVDHPYGGEQYIRMGGKMPDAPITCDGVEVIIGGELFRALRRIRQEDQALRIWVDALCINQQDLGERNEHVKIMGKVYAGACQTRVWLGESTEMDYHAVRTLSAISDVFEDLFVKRKVVDNNSTLHEVQWHFYNNAETHRLDWGLLAEMLNRSWFRRTWIIQEVANSSNITVHLGQIQLPWDLLTNVILALAEYKLQTLISECKAFKAIGCMENLRKERIDKSLAFTSMPFLTLLEELRDFNATIPSDKIYGILGLTDHKDDFIVDYSLSPEKVFTDFAVEHLRSGSLEILTHCINPSKPSTLSLPSWVPDWSRPGWVEPFRIRELQAKAAGDTKPELIVDAAAGILRIKGRVVDVVAEVETKKQIPSLNQLGPLDGGTDDPENGGTSDPMAPNMAAYGGPIFDADMGEKPKRNITDGNEPGEKEKPLNDAEYRLKKTMDKLGEHSEKWYRSVIDVAFPDKKTTPQMWENLWRTFMCNRTRDNKRPTDECATGMDIYYKSVLEYGKGVARILEERTDHQIACHGLEPQEQVAYYMKEKVAFETFIGAHTKWTYNRRFFRSENGRFGWAMDGTMPGDLVVVLYGCDFPIILRGDKDDKLRIVGDCYINGLMDGEGLEEDVAFAEIEFEII